MAILKQFAVQSGKICTLAQFKEVRIIDNELSMKYAKCLDALISILGRFWGVLVDVGEAGKCVEILPLCIMYILLSPA